MFTSKIGLWKLADEWMSNPKMDCLVVEVMHEGMDLYRCLFM